MGHAVTLRSAGRFVLECISLSTPRAIVITFSTALLTLGLWPMDRTQYLPVRSIWLTVFGFEPYSTGITRAVNRALHGEFAQAWEFNPLVIVVLPIAFGLVALNAVRWYRS